MIIKVVSQIQDGEEVMANAKGVEEMEIDVNEITNFNPDKNSRLIGLFKRGVYKLTLKSCKELQRELIRQGKISRFDYTKRK